MCLYPKLIENPKFKANKKNKGRPPKPIDERVKYVPIGCGKCMECLRKKGNEWKVRLLEEIKYNNKGRFVTFTFSNESYKELVKAVRKDGFDGYGYNLDNLVATKGVRRFLERWRKKNKKSLRHWLITELGSKNTERVHLHGIIFTEEKGEEICLKWKYGRIGIGYANYENGKKINKASEGFVNEQTIGYITKYLTKRDLKHKEYKPKILTSPGIGKKYLKSPNANNIYYEGKNTIEYYRTNSGIKTGLPIYYKNYLFNEEEREQLWLHKLDENKRFVNGKECKTEEEYLKRREYARIENEKLGFGNDKKNWDIRRYENQLKKLKQLQILKQLKIK